MSAGEEKFIKEAAKILNNEGAENERLQGKLDHIRDEHKESPTERREEHTLKEIVELMREQIILQRETINLTLANSRLLYHIFRSMTVHRVMGGVIAQIGDHPMATELTPIAPGNTPKFAVTPTPAGVVTKAESTQWASDNSLAVVTIDPSDPTGNTVSVAIDSTAAVGGEITLTWTYTNEDGTTATASATYPIVTVVLPVTNVDGGSIAQVG